MGSEGYAVVFFVAFGFECFLVDWELVFWS